jgi:hypothetical protein
MKENWRPESRPCFPSSIGRQIWSMPEGGVTAGQAVGATVKVMVTTATSKTNMYLYEEIKSNRVIHEHILWSLCNGTRHNDTIR